MKLAVGFITYNEATAKYLDDFLPSLEAALSFLKSADYRIYVFDNSDKTNLSNSRRLVQYQDIKYFCLGHNLGFARAYNVLIREALKDGAAYFLVINPDTLLEPEAIQRLVVALDSDDSLGSVAPKILRWDFVGKKKTNTIDSLGIILQPGLRFSDLGQGREDDGKLEARSKKGQNTGEILGPSGAAGLFSLSALKKIATTSLENRETRSEQRENFLGSQNAQTEPGENFLGSQNAHSENRGTSSESQNTLSENRGDSLKSQNTQYFDERFFMYKEDCDLAYRLALAGYGSRLVSNAIIYHDRTVAISGRGIKNFWRGRKTKSQKIRAWSFRNQHLLFLKYWKKQNLVNKIIVILRVLFLFIFSLILENFLLKEYFILFKRSRVLTNIK